MTAKVFRLVGNARGSAFFSVCACAGIVLGCGGDKSTSAVADALLETTADSPAGDTFASDGAIDSGECRPGGNKGYLDKPFDNLADYCVVDLVAGAIVPKNGVVPYDLNTPLFSDYAYKFRTVWAPEGSTVTPRELEAFDFPVGSILTKSFGYPDDARKPKPKMTWLETRIMYRSPAGWKAYSYHWDETQTKATLDLAGGVQKVLFTHTTGETLVANYLVPNANQCKKCHEISGEVAILGPTAKNLAKSYTYPSGVEDQLAHWVKVGLLKSTVVADPLPKWDDPKTGTVTARARAFMDVNCGHCHRPEGGASTTGLYLRYRDDDFFRLGVCKPPVAAGRATGDLQYDVVPGKPERSILIHRLKSVEPAIAMPELGRSLVPTEAVGLLEAWIRELPGTCAGEGDAGIADADGGGSDAAIDSGASG